MASRMIFKCALAVLACVPAAMHAEDASAAAIQQKLEGEYQLTKTNYDKTDIVTAGSVVVLQKDKVLMLAASSTNPCRNTYKDGLIKQSGPCAANEKLKKFSKFTSRLPGAGSVPDSPSSHTFVTGEKFWVTKIDVKEGGKDAGVMFTFFTDAIDDTRFATTLQIPFGAFTPTPDQVLKLVHEVITVAPSEDAKESKDGKGGEKGQAAPAEQQETAQSSKPAAPAAPVGTPAADAPAAPEAAPAPLEVPPPPPPDPAEISEGQTIEQVVGALGQPAKKAKVGTKEIYYYKDIKVTFVNGKVKDIQ